MANSEGVTKAKLTTSLMRFRLMEAETTDPIAMRFLHDIVVDLEAELDKRHRDDAVLSGNYLQK